MTWDVELDDGLLDVAVEHDLDACDHEVHVAAVLELLQLRQGRLGREEQVDAFAQLVLHFPQGRRDVFVHDLFEEGVHHLFSFELWFELGFFLF